MLKRDTGPIVPSVSLPLKLRKDPKYWVQEPMYEHMGIQYKEERLVGGRFKGGWTSQR